MTFKTKKLNFVWNDLYEDMINTRKELIENGHFADVTLISDDLKTFNVHRSILFPASNVLKQLLLMKQCKSEAIIFLKGINSQFLGVIIQFIYFGEVSVPEAQVKKFIRCAKDLDLKGFSGNYPTLPLSDIDNPDVNNGLLFGEEKLEYYSSPNHSNSIPATNPEDKEESEKQLYRCEKCEYIGKDATILKIHVNRMHNRASSVIAKYSCGDCTYTNVNPEKMKAHKKSKHSS